MTTLPEWANWLARDEDGSLIAFERKPHKDTDDLLWGEPENYGDSISFDETNRVAAINETDDTFSHIKWTDEEPTIVDKDRNTFKWLEKPDLQLSKETINEIFGSKVEEEPSLPDQEPTNIKRGLEDEVFYNSITNDTIAHGHDERPKLSITDIINEPNHYKGKHGIETIDVIRNFGNDDMVAGFYWGNAIKYMTRYRNKNGLEDLKKARRNLDWLIEHTEKVE